MDKDIVILTTECRCDYTVKNWVSGNFKSIQTGENKIIMSTGSIMPHRGKARNYTEGRTITEAMLDL